MENVNLSLTDSLLIEILEINRLILQELREEADEGKAMISNGTLSTTQFTIIDTQMAPGHSVKGYTIKNTDGANSLYVGHNIAMQPQLDIDIIDVSKIDPIFNIVEPNETLDFTFNRNMIKSVHLLAVTGAPTYKMWLTW